MAKPILTVPQQLTLLLVWGLQADKPTFNDDNAQRKELHYQFEQAKRQSRNERLKEKNRPHPKPTHFGKSSTHIQKSRNTKSHLKISDQVTYCAIVAAMHFYSL